MNPKNSLILHLGKYYWPRPGGIETAVQQISEAGAKAGYPVMTWVAQDKFKPGVIEKINHVSVRRFFSLGSLFSVPMTFGFFLSKKPAPKILHVHLPNPLAELTTLIFFRSQAMRFIPYVHAYPIGQKWLGKVWFNWITMSLLRRANKILISDPKIKDLIKPLSQFENKIVILPYSTDCLDKKEWEKIQAIREKNNYVLSVGRMVSYKGYQRLLEAWKDLRSQHPIYQNWKLVLIGDGPELPHLKQFANTQLDSNAVLFLGNCSDDIKKDWLKKSTFYVMSSDTTAETFGISLLEALGCGLPAIVSDLPGGVAALSRGGECGQIYPRNSKDALVSALLKLIESSGLRKQSGEANLIFAREHYSERHLIQTYQEIIK